MKSERNNPVPRKGTEIFSCLGVAQTHIATCLLNVNLGLCRRKSPPGRISALRRDKGGQFRHGIEHPNCRMAGEISCKKSKVKSFCRNAGERFAQAQFVRATPVATMMQKGGGWMQLAQDA